MQDIIPYSHKIQAKDRNLHKGHHGLVVWFTGLSGSGKSTLANLLEQVLFERNIHTYILDGDNIRAGLNKDLNFSHADRRENIRRISEVALLMKDAGVLTITAFISPFRQDRQQARDIVGKDHFVEVFIDCPLEVCEKRDAKGLYAKARDKKIKNFTGIDSPFEPPEQPDIIIHTDRQSEQACTKQLLQLLLPKIKLSYKD